MLERGDVSSVQIVEALHRRADEVEPTVRAFVHQFRDDALATAARRDAERAQGKVRGALHGLPVSLKENIATRGTASTLGMSARKDILEKEDAVCVKLLEAEGAVVLGKTNVPQTLLAPMESENALFGVTHNPWRTGHAPGGSSGGEGAAVASGSSIFGVGNDIGGSIRSPASLCGVCGIKPTVDRWSNRGCIGSMPGQEFVRSQCGPIARTVDDLILLMSALDSPKHTPFDGRVPPVPFGDPSTVDLSKLTVGYFDDDGYFAPAASVSRAIRESVEMLESLGVNVRRYRPINVEEILDGYLRAMTADGLVTLKENLAGEAFAPPLKTTGRIASLPAAGRKALAKVMGSLGERRISDLLRAFGEKRLFEVWALVAARTRHREEELDTWAREGIDLLLAPTLATPAPPQGMTHDFLLGFVNLARYNYLDLPAGTVPITTVRDDETTRPNPKDRVEKRAAQIEAKSAGLPVGVQIVGRPWEEATVLALMKALHDEAGGRDGFPKTPVG